MTDPNNWFLYLSRFGLRVHFDTIAGCSKKKSTKINSFIEIPDQIKYLPELEIASKSGIKTHPWRRSEDFIVDYEHI